MLTPAQMHINKEALKIKGKRIFSSGNYLIIGTMVLNSLNKVYCGTFIEATIYKKYLMAQELEFETLKMDVRERCAALDHTLSQMAFNQAQQVETQQHLNDLCSRIVKSSTALSNFLRGAQAHKQVKIQKA